MFAELIALLLIALVVLIPILALIVRLRSGEPTTGGSSWGRQYFGRRDDDWGPQPTRREVPDSAPDEVAD